MGDFKESVRSLLQKLVHVFPLLVSAAVVGHGLEPWLHHTKQNGALLLQRPTFNDFTSAHGKGRMKALFINVQSGKLVSCHLQWWPVGSVLFSSVIVTSWIFIYSNTRPFSDRSFANILLFSFPSSVSLHSSLPSLPSFLFSFLF